MGGFRGFAVFSITMVLGAGPGPAGAIARAPDETAHTASPYAYEAARTASPTRLFDRIAQALNREGLTVERRGDGVDIDPKVSIRVLHGIVIALPDNYRVHVTFDGGGRAREGVIGEIASRLVLQREDSRIAQRLNAVRAYSFTVRNADEDAILAPRIALGYDLPSEATPFARVEIRKTILRPKARPVKREKATPENRPRTQTAPARPEPVEPAPPLKSSFALAPQQSSQPAADAPPAAPTDLERRLAEELPAIAKAPAPSAKVTPRPSADDAFELLDALHREVEPASRPSLTAPPTPAPEKQFALRPTPVIIDRIKTTRLSTNAWRAEYRVVKARKAARRNTAVIAAVRPPPGSKQAMRSVSAVGSSSQSAGATAQARSVRKEQVAEPVVAPVTRDAVLHAQAGLSLMPPGLLVLAGLMAGACARRIQRRQPATTHVSEALCEAVDALVKTAGADTAARLRYAVARARMKALEPVSPSAAAQLLLFEETRRAAEAIQRRGDSAGAERLLEIIDRERRRLLTNAA